MLQKSLDDNNVEIGLGFRASTELASTKVPGGAVTFERTGGKSVGSLHFKTAPSEDNLDTRMTIDSAGNLESRIAPTPTATTVNETADFAGKVVIANGGTSAAGDRLPLIFNVGGNGADNISAAIVGEREASGWNSALSFWVNSVTAGSEGTDAIQEAMRIDSAGAVNINSGTVPAGQKLYVRCASDSNLAIGDASGTVKFNALNDANSANVPMEFGVASLSVVGGLATFGSGIAVTTGGVKFPATQSASADANVLDDYEEGTHVATLTCSTSGTITLNGSYDTLAYTKIGNMVHVQGDLEVSSVSSPVGRFDISLPFAISSASPAASNYVAATVAIGGVASANSADFVAFGDAGSSFRVYLGDGTNVVSDSAEQVQANTWIRVSFQYKAA